MSKCLIKSFTVGEIPSNSGTKKNLFYQENNCYQLSKVYSPFFTQANISASSSPKNGGTPESKTYRITPR